MPDWSSIHRRRFQFKHALIQEAAYQSKPAPTGRRHIDVLHRRSVPTSPLSSPPSRTVGAALSRGETGSSIEYWIKPAACRHEFGHRGGDRPFPCGLQLVIDVAARHST